MKLLVDMWLLRKDILLSKFKFMKFRFASCEKFSVVAKQNDWWNKCQICNYTWEGVGMADVFVCVRRTRDEVKALLVFHTGFNLAGEQVQPGWRFVRLHDRRGKRKEKKKVTLWCLCSAPQWKLFRDDIAEMERNDVIPMQKAVCVAHAYCCNDCKTFQ